MRSMNIEVCANIAEKLKKSLDEEFKTYRAGRMSCKAIREDRKNQHTVLECSITHDNDGDTSDSGLNEFICNGVSNYIVDYYEVGSIAKEISNKYSEYCEEEQEIVAKIAAQIISGINRKDIIARSLSRYFDTAEDIIFDGFVNFRLKEYKEKIEEAVTQAAADYKALKENT